MGRYPLRNERLLPLTEYVRRAIITGATDRDITVIATNSDGDPARRAFLLGQLGEGADRAHCGPWREHRCGPAERSRDRHFVAGVQVGDRALVWEAMT